MAEGKGNGNHGAPQRTNSDLKDIANSIKDLTTEVRKLRESFDASVKSANAKQAKERLKRFGANIVPKKVK